ncbi:hypothetical protein ACEPAF_2983 [Sanghuangporus sanghuang]
MDKSIAFMALSPRSAVVPTAPGTSDASTVLQSEVIAWYFLVAILTLLVYDAATMMDKEVQYFWIKPLKPVAIVYFANRYIGLLGAISNLFSKFAIWSRSLSYWATIVLIDCILMMRVVALYSKDRRLSISLNSLLVLAAAIKLSILIYITVIQDVAVYTLATNVTICGEKKSAAIGWGIVDWLAPMAYGVVLLALALRKAMQYWKMTSGFKTSRLVNVLIQDQIIYFLLVVLCCILNIIQFKIHVTNDVLAGILSTLGSPSLLCILGSRMLFNLKEAGNEDINERASVRAKSIGAIEFITLENVSTRLPSPETRLLNDFKDVCQRDTLTSSCKPELSDTTNLVPETRTSTTRGLRSTTGRYKSRQAAVFDGTQLTRKSPRSSGSASSTPFFLPNIMSESREEHLELKNVSTQLPTELFYPVCTYVASRRDLHTLATASRILQKPSEIALHRRVVLDSRDLGRKFIKILKECPRFVSLVRELQLERVPTSQETESDNYWIDMREVIGSLSVLESLSIEDGRDESLSWVLSLLPQNRLKILRCAFIMDIELFHVLRQQSTLEELAWKGGLAALPASPMPINIDNQSRTPQTGDNSKFRSSETSISDPDELLIPVIQQYLPPTVLPSLKYLTSESLALARVLIPGRAITHLWVPGSTFTAVIASHFIYRHITSASESNVPVSSSGHPIQLAASRLELSGAQRSQQLSRAIRDFAHGRGPVLSLRMALNMRGPDVMIVLDCIAQYLPYLRCLGFLPGHILDDGSATKLVDEGPGNMLPSFRHLHTICFWSVPTRRAVSLLQNASHLPALRTLACLHYSAAFEWLCLPIKDDDSNSSNAYRGGIEWNHEGVVEDGPHNKHRRATPVHDPRNLLWRDI